MERTGILSRKQCCFDASELPVIVAWSCNNHERDHLISSDLLHARTHTAKRISFSVAARGPSGMSPPCAGMVAKAATRDDMRAQLALWVAEEGDIEFIMGNGHGVGVILAAGLFPEGIWTHLAVSMEGRKVSCAR